MTRVTTWANITVALIAASVPCLVGINLWAVNRDTTTCCCEDNR